jgi:uncharacterized protein
MESLDAPTRMQLLNDHVDAAMLRDVVERHSVTNVAGLRWLLRHLMGNAGALFSVDTFYASLKSQGFAIAKDTVWSGPHCSHDGIFPAEQFVRGLEWSPC